LGDIERYSSQISAPNLPRRASAHTPGADSSLRPRTVASSGYPLCTRSTPRIRICMGPSASLSGAADSPGRGLCAETLRTPHFHARGQCGTHPCSAASSVREGRACPALPGFFPPAHRRGFSPRNLMTPPPRSVPSRRRVARPSPPQPGPPFTILALEKRDNVLREPFLSRPHNHIAFLFAIREPNGNRVSHCHHVGF
jgi:hypothetical protein